MECGRYDGQQKFQIYIDEINGYIIYNSQHRDSYKRTREYTVTDVDNDKTMVIDDGMDIVVNNKYFIVASDKLASFVFVRETSTYAYAWTSVLPISDDQFLAFGNHHDGSCMGRTIENP